MSHGLRYKHKFLCQDIYFLYGVGEKVPLFTLKIQKESTLLDTCVILNIYCSFLCKLSYKPSYRNNAGAVSVLINSDLPDVDNV